MIAKIIYQCMLALVIIPFMLGFEADTQGCSIKAIIFLACGFCWAGVRATLQEQIAAEDRVRVGGTEEKKPDAKP